jgi:hypothetical protein
LGLASGSGGSDGNAGRDEERKSVHFGSISSSTGGRDSKKSERRQGRHGRGIYALLISGDNKDSFRVILDSRPLAKPHMQSAGIVIGMH